MKHLNISIDPDLMGIEFNEKEKKDWKSYQKNRSSNKLMKHIRLGVPLVYEGPELEALLRSSSGNAFHNVSHVKTEGYSSSSKRLEVKYNANNMLKGVDPYTDVSLDIIP